MEYETARQNLQNLLEDYKREHTPSNESTTRLKFVNRLFLECLDWSYPDCVCEESHEGQYADYTFSTTRRALIVEAKREGNYFALPVGYVKQDYTISALARDYKDLAEAIKQVMNYCQSRGVPIAAVCNGHQLVAFVATRSDGLAPLDGRAIVFASLDEMLHHFLELWNNLSRQGIISGRLETRLLGRPTSPLPPKLSSTILGYPGIIGRNPFQADLQIVSDIVLEDLATGRTMEDRFLRDCYCKSGALSQYALVSKEILSTRYASLFADERDGPTLIPATTTKGISAEFHAESLTRRPILLVGDVGVGKTTFIRHLMRIDASDVFRDALTLYLDLGSSGALTSSLRDFIVDDITRQLREQYDVDIEERNFVRAVYHGELQRFAKGIYSDLRSIDSATFALKEIDFLESKMRPKEAHIRACVEHVAHGRRKQVVFFIDNADQRGYETQQQAFLIAQELADTWPATIFVALRPETFYKSQRQGTLSGYHPKAFTIAPPRIDEVLHKRLDFGLSLADGRIPIKALSEHVTVHFENLKWIIIAFKESLRKNTDLIEAIDNISAGNVRQALDLVRDFFGSGHVDTQKIIGKRRDTGSYQVPLHEFLRAVIYGDNKYYDPTRSPITNLFDISTNDPREHFILPLTLSVIISLSGKSTLEGFVDTRSVYDSLQTHGFSPHHIDESLNRGLANRLVESGRARDRLEILEMPQAVRLTTTGAYHVQKLIRMFVYLDAIAVDMRFLVPLVRAQITNVSDIGDRIVRAECLLEYLNDQWHRSGIVSEAFDWQGISIDLAADCKRIRLRST